MADEDRVVDSVEETLQQPTKPSTAPESGNEGEPSETQETGGENPTDWEKRYRDSSREAQKLREEREREAQRAQALEQQLLTRVTKTRESYEEFINEQGLSPQEKEYYMNIYDSQIAPSKKGTERPANEPPPSTPTDMIPPSARPEPSDPAREAWMNRMDSQERERMRSQSEATREFFEREENRSLPQLAKESIISTAAMLDYEYGYTPREALEAARRRLLDPELIKDEGYTEGVRDAMQGGISRGVTGGRSAGTSQIKLPKKHEDFVNSEIQRRGLKGEDAEKYRQNYASRLNR